MLSLAITVKPVKSTGPDGACKIDSCATEVENPFRYTAVEIERKSAEVPDVSVVREAERAIVAPFILGPQKIMKRFKCMIAMFTAITPLNFAKYAISDNRTLHNCVIVAG